MRLIQILRIHYTNQDQVYWLENIYVLLADISTLVFTVAPVEWVEIQVALTDYQNESDFKTD